MILSSICHHIIQVEMYSLIIYFLHNFLHFLVCNSQIEATINNLNQTKDKFTPVPDKVSSRSPTRLKKISKFKEARTAEVSSRNFVLFSLSDIWLPELEIKNL